MSVSIKIKQLFKYSVVAALSTLLFIGSTINTNAQSALSIMPGQSGTFSVTYSNIGEGGDGKLKNTLLYVNIGKELEIDNSSITDTFPAGGTAFKVVSSVVKTDTDWSSRIIYQPRSANNASAPSGTDIAGDIDLPNAETGVLKFTAKLKADVLSRYKVGDTLAPNLNTKVFQGIYTSLEYNNGAANKPGQIAITIAQPNAVSSSSSSSVAPVAPTCTKLASPATDKTTGGGFNKTTPQPTYSSVVFSPNVGLIESKLTVETKGLKDAGCGNDLEGANCSAILQGPNNFYTTANGTVSKGICTTTFTVDQTPKVAGTYQLVTLVQGASATLQTAPTNVEFKVPQTVLARTGGLEIALITGFFAAIIGIVAYVVSRRRKLDIGSEKASK